MALLREKVNKIHGERPLSCRERAFDAILNRHPSGFHRIPPEVARLVRKALEKGRSLRCKRLLRVAGISSG